MNNPSYMIGCISTAATVIIGAVGAHAVQLNPVKQQLFEKAKFYHFVNSVGLIVSSFNAPFSISSALFLAGIGLFSGSLYRKAFTGKEDYTKRLPPIGGICMVLGWTLLAFRK